MDLANYNWYYPTQLDNIKTIINSYGNPAVLKEKLFYLSLFLNIDVVKLIGMLYHKTVYNFTNHMEYLLGVSCNKYQFSLIDKTQIYDDQHKFIMDCIRLNDNKPILLPYKLFRSNNNQIGPCKVTNYVVGLIKKNNIDISKIKTIKAVFNSVGYLFDLTAPFSIIDEGRIYKLYDIPFYIFMCYTHFTIEIDADYSIDELVNNILTCNIDIRSSPELKLRCCIISPESNNNEIPTLKIYKEGTIKNGDLCFVNDMFYKKK